MDVRELAMIVALVVLALVTSAVMKKKSGAGGSGNQPKSLAAAIREKIAKDPERIEKAQGED